MRSFHIGHHQIPVCARCLGLIFGLPIGVLTAALGIIFSRWFGAVCWIPLVLDGGTQEMGFRLSNNVFRFITGLLAGIGTGAFLILWIIRDLNMITGLQWFGK